MRCIAFVDWKNQHSTGINTTQTEIYIQVISSKIPASSQYIDKFNLKFI